MPPTEDADDLRRKLAHADAVIAELRGVVVELRKQIDAQQAHIHRLVKMTPGRSSERVPGATAPLNARAVEHFGKFPRPSPRPRRGGEFAGRVGRAGVAVRPRIPQLRRVILTARHDPHPVGTPRGRIHEVRVTIEGE